MRHVRKRACDVRHAWARHGGYGLARVLVRAGLGVGVARFLRGDFRKEKKAKKGGGRIPLFPVSRVI